MRSKRMSVLAWFVTLAGLAFGAPLSAETVTGSAFYRERILPPPGSVFEATLEDVSLADAPATRLARFEADGRAGPPYRFTLEYDPATIDPSRTYAVRAMLRDGTGRLLFTSDTHMPVLTRGAGREVDIMMVRVPGDRADRPGSIGAHGLDLPASFTGTLPCADCEGIAYHLDLWPDQSYHLRRTWLGRAGDNRRDELGVWHADPGRNAIVLFGGDDTSTRWEVKDERSLRLLDRDGNPIDSDLNYALTSNGALTETDLEGLFLGGMMRYMADAASFEECVTGKTYPIAMEGGYLDLERAYLNDRETPGAPLHVTVEGSLLMRPAMEGPDRRSLVVERFVATRPGITCEQQRANASLTNTYWRIESLRDAPVTPAPGAREPHIVLLEGDEPRYAATVGCNRMAGSFTRDDAALSFGAGLSTMMACPPPLDALERQLSSVLSDVRSYGIAGQTLVLQDGDGAVIALLTAVYLR
jgi:uncharacterized lipoprotein YbaY/uncharacterized lipoprotein NlpE involved in copper resistance